MASTKRPKEKALCALVSAVLTRDEVHCPLALWERVGVRAFGLPVRAVGDLRMLLALTPTLSQRAREYLLFQATDTITN
jgi:hypothetical protein